MDGFFVAAVAGLGAALLLVAAAEVILKFHNFKATISHTRYFCISVFDRVALLHNGGRLRVPDVGKDKGHRGSWDIAKGEANGQKV